MRSALVAKGKWKEGKATRGNMEATNKSSGKAILWRKLEDFKRRIVLVEDKSY